MTGFRNVGPLALSGCFVVLLGCSGEGSELGELRRSPHIPRLEAFLERCTEPKVCAEARDLLDDLCFERARGFGNVWRYLEYLERFPRGRSVEAARTQVRHLVLEKIDSDPDDEILVLAEKLYGDESEIRERIAEVREEMEYRALSERRDLEALDRYLSRTPPGRFHVEIAALVQGIATEETRSQNTLEAWVGYLERYPRGDASDTAKERIAAFTYPSCFGGEPELCARYLTVSEDPERTRLVAPRLAFQVLPLVLQGQWTGTADVLDSGMPSVLPFQPEDVERVLVRQATRTLAGNEGHFFLLVETRDGGVAVYLPYVSVRHENGFWKLSTEALSNPENWWSVSPDTALPEALGRIAGDDKLRSRGPSFLVEYLAPRQCHQFVEMLRPVPPPANCQGVPEEGVAAEGAPAEGVARMDCAAATAPDSESPPPPEIVATLVTALARSRCPESVNVLGDLLVGGTASMRATVALALGEVPEDRPELADVATNRLLSAHATESEEMVRLVILQTVARIAPTSTTAYIADRIDDLWELPAELSDFARHLLFAAQFYYSYRCFQRAAEVLTAAAAGELDAGTAELAEHLNAAAIQAQAGRDEVVPRALAFVQGPAEPALRVRAAKDLGRIDLVVPLAPEAYADIIRTLRSLQETATEPKVAAEAAAVLRVFESKESQ
jgi:hypothetical protein